MKLIFFPLKKGGMICSHCRLGAPVDETNNPVTFPGSEPSKPGTFEVNSPHDAHADAYEGALRTAVNKMDVTLVVELHECKVSNAKGIRMSMPLKAQGRPAKRLSCVCASRKEENRAVYWMYVCVTHGCVFFPRKSDAADTFEQCLLIADPKVIEGISSDVLVVGLDGEEELSKGKFGNLCRERNRKKGLISSYTSEYNEITVGVGD